MMNKKNGERMASGSMAATINARRHRYIMDQIKIGNPVLVKEAARTLNVSEATIRRDLQLLEEKRLLVRVHGGATAPAKSTILPLTDRKTLLNDEKSRIARKAAPLIEGSDTVFVSGGTTMLAFARRLAAAPPPLCVTNMIDVGLLLGASGHCNVILLGGHLDCDLRVVRGLSLSEQLSQYRFDAVVTSTNAVCSDGFLDHDEQSYHNRRQLCTLTDRHIVLADHTKFGRKSRFLTMPLGSATDLVTDREPDQIYIRALREAGVNLHIAG